MAGEGFLGGDVGDVERRFSGFHDVSVTFVRFIPFSALSFWLLLRSSSSALSFGNKRVTQSAISALHAQSCAASSLVRIEPLLIGSAPSHPHQHPDLTLSLSRRYNHSTTFLASSFVSRLRFPSPVYPQTCRLNFGMCSVPCRSRGGQPSPAWLRAESWECWNVS